MSAADLTNKIYYCNWAKNANIVWVDVDNLDLSEGGSVMMADPKIPALVGDISRSFKPVKTE